MIRFAVSLQSKWENSVDYQLFCLQSIFYLRSHIFSTILKALTNRPQTPIPCALPFLGRSLSTSESIVERIDFFCSTYFQFRSTVSLCNLTKTKKEYVKLHAVFLIHLLFKSIRSALTPNIHHLHQLFLIQIQPYLPNRHHIQSVCYEYT